MRKLIFFKYLTLLFIYFAAVGCARRIDNLLPIEQYKGCVVTEISDDGYRNTSIITFKTKDSIFYAPVLNYDAENLKIGDTIK